MILCSLLTENIAKRNFKNNLCFFLLHRIGQHVFKPWPVFPTQMCYRTSLTMTYTHILPMQHLCQRTEFFFVLLSMWTVRKMLAQRLHFALTIRARMQASVKRLWKLLNRQVISLDGNQPENNRL